MVAACRKAVETSLWAHFVARVHANGPSARTKRKRSQRRCRFERAQVAPQQRTRIPPLVPGAGQRDCAISHLRVQLKAPSKMV
jgi:hypothetical protein